MACNMKPMASGRRAFTGIACAAQPKRLAVPRNHAHRPSQAGKSLGLVLPAILGPGVSAAFADEIEKIGEAGRQALSSSQVPSWSSVQVPSGLQAPDGIVNVLGDGANVNPLLLVGAVASLAIPALIFQALNANSGKAKSTPPSMVLKALQADARTVLVDIRSAQTVKTQGSPDLSSAKRRVVSLPYTRVAREGDEEVVKDWGAKFAKLAAIKADSIVVLIDSDGKQAPKASADIPEGACEELFFVAGGADAWEKSGQPWKQPGRGFAIDFSGITNTLPQVAGTLKVKAKSLAESSKAAGGPAIDVGDPKTLLVGGGAILGAIVLASNTGLFLELVGLGAAAQLAYKNLFYAEDRERTISKVRKLVDENIALDDAPKDLQKLANVFLDAGGNVVSSTQQDINTGTGRVKARAKKAVDQTASAAQQTAEKAETGADEAAEQTKAAAKDLGSQGQQAADQAADAADQAAAKTADAAEGAGSDLGDAAEESKKQAEEAASWINDWKEKQKA